MGGKRAEGGGYHLLNKLAAGTVVATRVIVCFLDETTRQIAAVQAGHLGQIELKRSVVTTKVRIESNLALKATQK